MALKYKALRNKLVNHKYITFLVELLNDKEKQQ